MSDPSGRIAVDITATANVAEVAKARSEVSALGDAATKATKDIGAASTQAAKEREIFNEKLKETNNDMVAAAKAVQAFRQGQQGSTQTTTEWTRAMYRAEEAAHRFESALATQQRRMALLHAEALKMNDALDEMGAAAGEGGGGHGVSHSAARGLGELGRGLAQVAQTGHLSAFSLREFTGAAFRLGAELGPTGLGAIIGLSVLAIGTLVEVFGKAGDAAKKANEEFQKTLETLARGSLEAVATERQHLFSGDPMAMLTGPREGESSIAFQARAGGQQWLEQERSRLQPILDQLDRATNKGTTATTAQKIERDSYVKQLTEINTLLNATDFNLARLSGVYDALLKKQKDIEAFQLQQMRDKRDMRSVSGMPVDSSLLRGTGTSRADLLGSLRNIGDAPMSQYGMLIAEERELAVQLNRTNLTYKERLDLYKQLGQVQTQVANFGRVDTSKIGAIRPIDLKKFGETAWERDHLADLLASEELQKKVETRVGNSLADGLAAGIRAGFKGPAILNAFRAGSKTIFAGLGGMLIDEGKIYIAKSAIMTALVPHLFNPVTSGWAAAGIGAALIGLGASLEGLATLSGSRGGGGGYAATGNTFSSSNIGAGGGTTLIVQTVNPWSREVVSATTYYINRGQMLNTPVIPPPGAPS